MTLSEKVAVFSVIRDLFPKCFYCGESMQDQPLTELVAIAGRNRLAHQECPKPSAQAVA